MYNSAESIARSSPRAREHPLRFPFGAAIAEARVIRLLASSYPATTRSEIHLARYDVSRRSDVSKQMSARNRTAPEEESPASIMMRVANEKRIREQNKRQDLEFRQRAV